MIASPPFRPHHASLSLLNRHVQGDMQISCNSFPSRGQHADDLRGKQLLSFPSAWTEAAELKKKKCKGCGGREGERTTLVGSEEGLGGVRVGWGGAIVLGWKAAIVYEGPVWPILSPLLHVHLQEHADAGAINRWPSKRSTIVLPPRQGELMRLPCRCRGPGEEAAAMKRQ